MEGRSLAGRLLDQARSHIDRLRAEGGQVPSLVTVTVGEHPSTATYIRMKARACQKVGMASRVESLPGDATTADLVTTVERLAADRAVHGILVQHPVPTSIDKRAVFEAIPPEKDVDGVSSATLGRVLLGLPALISCTPRAILALLEEYRVNLDGARAIVMGRSPILGRPLASLLINAHATVTLCHSRTSDLPALCREADVVVAAVGKPRHVKGDWIKRGAVVIDAGYNEGSVGDVDFDEILPRASLLTPVPGGVGPVTIATLVAQTVETAARQMGIAL